MRILITGHHGYIGSVLAPLLREAGHEVVGFDAFYYRDCDFGEELEFEPALERDVRDLGPADLEGFDAVVHLAALSNDPVGDLNTSWTYGINLEGTVSLARAARKAGVRKFVFASSCSLYGASGDDRPLKEDAPMRPLTPYAETKMLAEEALAQLAGGGFVPVFMRNATAYGVSPRLRLDVVLNNLVAWAHTTGAIVLQSDGRSWRPLVHVQDAARAAVALLEAPDATVSGEAFNVGSDEQNYRIRDLAEGVRAHLPDCRLVFADGASADPRSYRVDFSKLASVVPDFRCEWTAQRGVEELAEAYERFGLTLDEFQGYRFIRVEQLKRLLAEGELDANLRRHAISEA